MSAQPQRKQKYTIEEYIELLQNSEERFEYFDGEVFSMAAGKIAHSGIVVESACCKCGLVKAFGIAEHPFGVIDHAKRTP